jgi:hypothetical protein
MVPRVAGPILLVKGYSAGIFCIEKRGLAMRLGKGGEAAAALLTDKNLLLRELRIRKMVLYVKEILSQHVVSKQDEIPG